MVNDVEVPLPEVTDPVPVQPVQVQTVLPSVTGLATLQVTVEPSSCVLVPTAGLGEPWAETTFKLRCTGVPCQFQVMLESWVIVKVTDVPVPDGADPVPDQPLQVQIMFPSVTGLTTLQVT
jgi:hypothetical protein